VPHEAYRAMSAAEIDARLNDGGLLADLKRIWPSIAAKSEGLSSSKSYWSL
jgi:hypothetical protein